MASTATLQKTTCGRKPHTSSSDTVVAGATMLRRRLSNSFQRDSIDRGLRSRLPARPGTRPSNQPISCQSPRIQRCRRLTSAS